MGSAIICIGLYTTDCWKIWAWIGLDLRLRRAGWEFGVWGVGAKNWWEPIQSCSCVCWFSVLMPAQKRKSTQRNCGKARTSRAGKKNFLGVRIISRQASLPSSCLCYQRWVCRVFEFRCRSASCDLLRATAICWSSAFVRALQSSSLLEPFRWHLFECLLRISGGGPLRCNKSLACVAEACVAGPWTCPTRRTSRAPASSVFRSWGSLRARPVFFRHLSRSYWLPQQPRRPASLASVHWDCLPVHQDRQERSGTNVQSW